MISMITPAQLRKVHVLAKECGLDGDTLHEHVYALTKKDSIAALTLREAIKVIDSLSGKEQTTDGMMTAAQQRYIRGLAKEIGMTDDDGRLDEARLLGFIREKYHVERMNWLTAKKASDVIEGLKAIKERQAKAVV